MQPIDRVREIARAATLESIYLQKCNSDISLPPEAVTADLGDVKINYSFGNAYADETKTLFSFVAVDVVYQIKPEHKAKNPELQLTEDRLFGVHSTFVARYAFSMDIKPDECDMFTRSNALFNVYPYLREHVSAILVKMGINGFLLPLFKVPVPTTEQVAPST